MMRYLISSIAVACMLAVACNKPLEKPVVTTVTSDTTFNLVNRDTLDLHVSLYRSADDMRAGINASASVLVPANGVYKIPFSKIDTHYSILYFYEVHSADYKISNWAAYYDQSYPLFYMGHSFQLNNLQTTGGGYYFLHGGSASVTWKAVDKIDWNDNSVWSALSNDERYMVVTLNRNKYGTVSRKSSSSVVSADITEMRATMSNMVNRLNIYVASSGNYDIHAVKRPQDINMSSRQTRDTILMYDNSYYWVLARQ